MIPDRFAYLAWDFAGYWLCEFVFRAWRKNRRWVPGLHSVYRLGCYCCGKGTEAALRYGALVDNPKADQEHEPLYVWASWAKHP